MSKAVVHIKDAGGTWRKLCSDPAYVFRSGVWRRIDGEKIYADGQWRDIVCDLTPDISLIWYNETPSITDIGGNSPTMTRYSNLAPSQPLTAGQSIQVTLGYKLTTSTMTDEQHTWSKIGVSLGVSSGGVIQSPNHFGTVAQDGSDKDGDVTIFNFTESMQIARIGLWVRCDGDEATYGSLRSEIDAVTKVGTGVNVSGPSNHPDAQVDVTIGSW